MYRSTSNYLIIFLCFCTFWITAQPKVTVRLDKNKIEIGDQLEMRIKVTHPADMKVFLPEATAIGAAFEVLQYSDSQKALSKKQVVTERNLTITTFDSGTCVVERLPIAYQKKGIVDTTFSEKLQIQVTSPVIDTSEFIAPIRDIFQERLSFEEDVLPFILVILALLFLSGILFFVIKKQKNKVVEHEIESQAPLLPPHVFALLQLDALERGTFLEKGDFKNYYTELSHILREYIEKRYGILALELVTSEILAELAFFELPDDAIDALRNVLQTADLVKYAKVMPSDFENQNVLAATRLFIERTKLEMTAEDIIEQ